MSSVAHNSYNNKASELQKKSLCLNEPEAIYDGVDATERACRCELSDVLTDGVKDYPLEEVGLHD